ncbi:MAG: hypothetical protein QNK04_30285 [Myxococcota bacterium]|nr:hypothetical protein [Myxococcota bacterium]
MTSLPSRLPALRLAAPAHAALLATLLVGAAASSARADGPVDLRRLFPQEAPFTVERPGLVRLLLPREVIQACRPDLSDLRVFDHRDREVPYAIASQRLDEVLEITETVEGRVLGLRRDEREPELGPTVLTETYTLAPPLQPPKAGTWDLVFEVSHARFVREVTVRQRREGSEELLAGSEPLFQLDRETRRTRLTLPPLTAQPLTVEIVGKEGFHLEPHFRFESARRLDPLDRSVVALEELSREHVEGTTLVELARPSGLVPDRIRVETSTGSLSREVAIFDEQPGRADLALGHGRVFQVDGGRGGSLMHLSLRRARGATLRIEIEDGDSPPLEDLRFHAVVRRPVLLFDLPRDRADASGGASGTLRFGGGRALRPRYDVASLRPATGKKLTGEQLELVEHLVDGELPVAVLAAIRPNPLFDATPALRFAMQPGAPIDTRIFAHRRSIQVEPSSEGLSRLRLAPEDTAHSRADLADIRVVDADARQWPYLMQRNARAGKVSLEVTALQSQRRSSRLELELPVAPLRLSRITLHSEAPFYDRGYELLTFDEHGNQKTLARGRIVKQARRPRPTRISFPAQPVSELELVIDDGDDAPLDFHEITARVSLPELFLVAPAGTYSLLIGNPDVRAPRYELERVRDVVLAVSGNRVVAAPLQANHDYSLAASLRGEDGPGSLLQAGLVWGVLLVAVVVLGILTLRVARQAPPATDESREG